MALERKKIIQAAKQSGFSGTVTDAVAVKSHIQNEIDAGSEFVVDGESLTTENFDSAWAKTSTITLSSVNVPQEVTSKGRNPNVIIADDETSVPQRFSVRNVAHAAYKSQIKRGKAVFDDADTAEAFGAHIRMSVMKGHDYDHRGSDIDIVKKTQAGQTNTLGGATVPIQFMDSIIYLTEQYGFARKLASVWKMTSDTMWIPRQTSVPTMQYVGENGTIAATSTTNFDNVQLTARKGAFLVPVPRELMQDSAINIADRIARNFAEAQSIGEDQAFFNGTGTAAFGGQVGLIAALPASAYINASGSSWGAITAADIFKIMGSVENINPARLRIECSRQFFVQVLMRLDKATSQFKELASGNLSPSSASWMGYPVDFIQVMPTASASGHTCMYFGDFAGASAFGDRQMLEISTSDHAYFALDQVGVRAITRFHVAVHGDGRSSFGPVCALKTT